MKIFNELAKSKSIVTGEPVALLKQLYQSLGVILHRENARSVVKRMPAHTHTSDAIVGAASVLRDQGAAPEE